ncbi:MAG TPA: hypothetical protein PKJ19_07685 [Flavobacteriales bacterium]|nr:hypothetical protein [Flavobacteriales bacterium]HNU55443.1 hypothetical protein [Flavobacteriales bacterium]
MIRTLLLSAILGVSLTSPAQTIYRITNVTITEKEQVTQGQDAMAEIRGAEGTDRVIVYAANDIELRSKVKVSTQNVRRSSVKSSAVNAIFEIDLKMDGQKDNRRVEKIYYMDQERKSHFKEKFIFKSGNQVRVVTVEFDGSLE